MKIKDIVDSFTGGGSEPVLPDTPDPKANQKHQNQNKIKKPGF